MVGYLSTHIDLNPAERQIALASRAFLTELKKEIDKVGAADGESAAIGSVIGVIEQILDGGSF